MTGKCDLKSTRVEPQCDMANKMISSRIRRFSPQLVLPRGFAIASLMVLLLVTLWPMGGSVAASQETTRMFDGQSIIEKLEELIEALEKSKDEVQGDVSLDAGHNGETEMMSLNMRLFSHINSASRSVDDILDPMVEPNLDPVDAGEVENVVPPTSLIQYANTTLGLAYEALAAATSLGQPLRDEVIGSKLKTIDLLMPGYYAAAGF